MTFSNNPVPVWHPQWSNMMSWFWAQDAVMPPNAQNLSSRLLEVRDFHSKARRMHKFLFYCITRKAYTWSYICINGNSTHMQLLHLIPNSCTYLIIHVLVFIWSLGPARFTDWFLTLSASICLISRLVLTIQYQCDNSCGVIWCHDFRPTASFRHQNAQQCVSWLPEVHHCRSKAWRT